MRRVKICQLEDQKADCVRYGDFDLPQLGPVPKVRENDPHLFRTSHPTETKPHW